MVTQTRALLKELTRLEAIRDARNNQSKRNFKRFVIRGDAELAPMDRYGLAQQAVPILLRDIGRGGLGFVCESSLPVDSTWHVSFIKDGLVVATRGLIVRHCRHVHDNAWLVGGQFCLESGLMTLFGIKPNQLRDQHYQDVNDASQVDSQDSFLAPEDL